jgi:hypothetical protein
MPLYEAAFVAAVALFAALTFMQVMMRQQVHHARFGSHEISPWNERFSNSLFGQYGIWNLHKRTYERSGLRSSFVVRGRVRGVPCVNNRGRLRLPLRLPRTLTSLLLRNCHRLTDHRIPKLRTDRLRKLCKSPGRSSPYRLRTPPRSAWIVL